MAEEHVYTEKELSKMADEMLAESDCAELPADETPKARKKNGKKKDALPEQSVKTP